MGLIKKIKQMFSKNIDCADKLDGKIFYFYTSKSRTVTVGANIIVPDGYKAIFVCKDKVTDEVGSGKFAISAINFPRTFKRLKIEKSIQKGKKLKNFLADVYYISINEISDMKFSSYTPYKGVCDRLGKVKAHSEGYFNIKIIEPDKLLKYMLMERAFLTEELFLDLLGGIVGDYVNKVLSTCEKSFFDLISNPKYCEKYIAEQLELYNYFDDLGVQVNNIKIDFLKVSKKLKQKVEEEMSSRKKFTIEINDDAVVKQPVKQPTINAGRVGDVSSQMQIPNTKSGRKCPYCNGPVNVSARFCEHCGNDLVNF